MAAAQPLIASWALRTAGRIKDSGKTGTILPKCRTEAEEGWMVIIISVPVGVGWVNVGWLRRSMATAAVDVRPRIGYEGYQLI